MNPTGPVLALCLASATIGAERALHSFTKKHLDKFYWSEGATFGDLNRDGYPDAISGPWWYEAPEFETRRQIYPATTTFTLKKEDGTEAKIAGFEGALGKKNAYSNDNFFAFVHDFDGDGWNDILTYGLPGTPAYVYVNPQEKGGHWKRHQVFDAVDNESPTFADIDGDGRPEIICNSGGTFGYAGPASGDFTAKWPFTSVTVKGPWGNFNHGLGIGDVNGDGRLDLLERGAWWEQPARGQTNLWMRHPAAFSPGGGAQMFAHDVNGDGLNDVVTSIAGHGFGLGWFEQLHDKSEDGHPKFKGHIFMDKSPEENRYGISFSQLHAVELVDVDGDGRKDIITGKCFWAHGPTGDPDPAAPAVLYWFRQAQLPDGGIDWVPHLIDDDSGVGRQIGLGDYNKDGLVDLIIGNKKGTFVFQHSIRKVSEAEWQAAQPAVKYPDARDKELKFDQVIQRTGPPRQ